MPEITHRRSVAPAVPTPTVAHRGRRLTLLVPVGATLFTLAWLVLGAISPGYELFGHTISPYSWIAQPVSGLGLGVTGAWMNTAFVAGGALVTIGTLASFPTWRARGRKGTTAVVLMSAMGIGMMVCGVFTLSSIMLHLLGFLLAVPLPAIGFLFAAAALRPARRGLALVGVIGAVLTLGLFVLFQLTFDATGAGGNDGIAGAVQRGLIVVAMATQSALVVGASRADHSHD